MRWTLVFHIIVFKGHRILCRIRIKVGALGCWQAMASCPLASQCTQKNADKNIHSCRRNGYIIIC
ncbi:hypothetical protein HMPREF1991_02858 [Hoylesella loescheii DSM 19665 = JCM 12249 = ATCC 15930]|uniref:Uncharacterized protein n=1 Tax=Hoylesella loescheii DSM 19665 = JCM 12249 = ATCC 15930 TaxID=1122985 RepID=A0A069QML3_HOYLO|nr:hypothetical protein HMPREF1991_02858 [Hoylesella loescheii DSM 19665 = JCM 12249 = ATCC 15930]